MSNQQTISDAFPFESKFIEINGQQIHYVDEGEGDPVLFLHGNPTSSYVWRNIIPYAAQHGRAIAIDLIGMGKSSKPDIDYRFFDHVPFVDGFIEKLGLKGVTLVMQDWGAVLGFHYAHRYPTNVRGIAFMEAVFRPMTWERFPADFRAGFKLMRTPGVGWLMISVFNIFVNKILPSSMVRKISEKEIAHYREPYPTIRSRRPLRQWPCEIPVEGSPSDVYEVVNAYNQWLAQTDTPMILFYAQPGGILREDELNWCKDNISNLETIDIGPGLHFIQEDSPHLIGKGLLDWLGRLG